MSESIQCWQCGTRMTLDELASNDGDCPRCEVEVHLAEYLDNALSRLAELEAELAKLRAELGQMVVPDDLLARCADWCDGNPKQPWYGRTAGDMVRTFMACQPLCTPSAPKADDPVKQMLLEALEALSKSAPSACCVDFHHRPCDYHGADKPCPALDRYEAARLAARAAIAAARKGEHDADN